MELRKHNSSWLKANANSDLNKFITFIQSPNVQTNLKLYIEALQNKNF